MNTALMILGMHRSGTSYLAESCGKLGFSLPQDLVGPAPDNPRGHFEPLGLVALNTALLHSIGTDWDCLDPPDQILAALHANSDAIDLAKGMGPALDQGFGHASRAIIKDPRLSLLLPFWRPYLDRAEIRSHTLIALRDPHQVAGSLARRNGMAGDLALLLWCNHMLGACEVSAGQMVTMIHFPDWTTDVPGMVARLRQKLEITVSNQATTSIENIFQRSAVHTIAASSKAVPSAPVRDLAMAIYTDLAACAVGELSPDPGVIARHRKDYLARSALWRDADQRLACIAAASQRHVMVLSSSDNTLRHQIADLQAATTTVQARADAALHLVDVSQQANRAAHDTAQSDRHIASQTIAAQTAQLFAVQSRTAQLGAELQQSRAAAASLHTELTGARKRASRTQSALDRSLGQIIELRRNTAEKTAKNEQLINQITRLQAEVADAEIRLTPIMQAVKSAEDTADDLRHALHLSEQQGAQSQAEIVHLQNTLADIITKHASLRAALDAGSQTRTSRAYASVYRFCGTQLRRILPARVVEQIKRVIPTTTGVPTALAFDPLPTIAMPTAPFTNIPAPGPGEKSDIYILSIINWDFRTQRPQHLATEMSRAGHRVFFIEMELDGGAGSARLVAPNVHVIRLGARGIGFVRPYSGVPTPRQARAWIDAFYGFCDTVGATAIRQVIIEHPYWWNFAKHLASDHRLTFDCMDEISGFSNTEPHILQAEADMILQADKMIVSSQYLYDKYAAKRDVALVRNGTDVSHFIADDAADAVPSFLAGKLGDGAIKVGYVGAIAEWFDTNLLHAVAQKNPDFDIHLCGAVTDQAPMALGQLANVTLHGEIPYLDVPAFLRAMDVLIIPFQLLPIIKACDPVKFYEYAAVMRPTVATALPELARAGDLVFVAHTPPEFASHIRTAASRGGDGAFKLALRQYALDNAWSFRADAALAHLAAEPLVSVILLHYGDPELTLAAIHSLRGCGEIWPNLQVIISDNSADPAGLARLHAATDQDQQVIILENGRNLGFAGGNNAGILAAQGDFVLLLNNDTFVPAGAISAMVRHLQRNPNVGIVGPMTNNIGNEARIDVHYADMPGMARIARELSTGYRGTWSPITVCAYFCAMFRRNDLHRIGLLPEVYGRGMFEDDDHCASFRDAGFDLALAEDAFVHHHLSATFGALPDDEKQTLFARNRATFEARWGPWMPHQYRKTRPAGSIPARR